MVRKQHNNRFRFYRQASGRAGRGGEAETPADAESPQTRQCIVTRELLPKEQLIRFVIGPKHMVVPDLACKLPGRGLWVKADMASVAEAAVKKAFGRAARAQATVPPGLAAQVEELLRKRALDALSMARKAGLAISGYEKVREMIAAGDAACIVHASDGAGEGIRGADAYGNTLPSFRCFDRDSLSQVMGRDNVVHIALASGPATEFFMLNARRFAGFS